MTTQAYAATPHIQGPVVPVEAPELGGDQTGPVSVEIDGRVITLEGAAAAAVRDVVAHFTAGRGVYVGTLDGLLTTGKAAELMGVSRSHICNLMDRGELPFRHVGTHRRVRAADVLAHVEQQRSVTRDALDEVAEASREHGMYEDDV